MYVTAQTLYIQLHRSGFKVPVFFRESQKFSWSKERWENQVYTLWVRGKGFQHGLTLSFVLASPKLAYAPDRNERATLKMAGLGEESLS